MRPETYSSGAEPERVGAFSWSIGGGAPMRVKKWGPTSK
jgi:hypothetical protein